MDAKDLVSENVYIRMEPPPNTKKVPLLFQAWLVVTEAKENIFANCALAQDRTGESLQWIICQCSVLRVLEVMVHDGL